MIARLAALTRDVDRILAPTEVILRFDRMRLRPRVIAETPRGAPLVTWRFGEGAHDVLLYGFPDPGEAVGGTVLTVLADAWLRGELAHLDVTWHCLPVANPDDQPNNGRTLETVRKTAAQEIDWWTDAPRPEAVALLAWADTIRPRLILPLHDEFHDGVARPAYFPTSAALPTALCDAVRALFDGLEHPISDDLRDPQMGRGFARMAEIAGDAWPRSTFHALAHHGPVLIPEVSACRPAPTLVQAQLGVILLTIEHLL